MIESEWVKIEEEFLKKGIWSFRRPTDTLNWFKERVVSDTALTISLPIHEVFKFGEFCGSDNSKWFFVKGFWVNSKTREMLSSKEFYELYIKNRK